MKRRNRRFNQSFGYLYCPIFAPILRCKLLELQFNRACGLQPSNFQSIKFGILCGICEMFLSWCSCLIQFWSIHNLVRGKVYFQTGYEYLICSTISFARIQRKLTTQTNCAMNYSLTSDYKSTAGNFSLSCPAHPSKFQLSLMKQESLIW